MASKKDCMIGMLRGIKGTEMKWNKDYATGVEQVDRDHQMIFQMSEDFSAALDEGLGGKVYSLMLDNLSVYCRGHFSFEERCMTEYHYPVAHLNKEAHKKFMQTLSGF